MKAPIRPNNLHAKNKFLIFIKRTCNFLWYFELSGIFYLWINFHQGILGSVDSGKSALVHRYLTGSYLSDESPEGI